MTVEAVLGRDYIARTLPLVQYDDGQKIHLSGIDLPASYLAEFSNCEYGTAPQITQTTDTITVPKEYLESGDPIHIWIVVTGPDERTTRYKIYVPVRQRGEPDDYVPTPSEKTAIEAAIEALNEAVADSQAAITHYPRIINSMWEVWDVANQRWTSTFVKAEGEDGRSIIGAVLNDDYTLTLTFSDNTTYTTPSIRGGEGFSPIATVVKEGRAATITITDQNGTTTAQVYDADPTTIIDDTAGIGATGKVWSADKSATSLAGKADLDVNGKVPSSQLPSYVDDVLEYADLAHFPAEGETGKIYVALDTNKTYRWGGSEYAEISASLALGETSSTAYAGDRGKIAYDHAVAKGISTAGEAIYKITTNPEGHVSSATAATLGDLTALGVAPKNDPDFTSSISMGRKANTTVGSNSVAVGYEVTASGAYSHAEGYGTIAEGANSHAGGKWNVADAHDTYAHIIGNGTANDARSNAYALDWDGNGHYQGDVYVGCNSDSTGGTKVATITDIPTVPVTDVQVNGTSILNNGVANVPIASYSTPGVIKVSTNTRGLYLVGSEELAIASAPAVSVQAGVNDYRPIVPSQQHSAAFYGLAKAAGDSTQSASSNPVGTYTESAKSAISQMLDAPETVSGSTPSITAKAGVRYICGECATLSFTPSASGDCEVIFESGTTATVLTLPNTVKMPDWFDATSLEANRTYDIIITNGVYGVVTSWA